MGFDNSGMWMLLMLPLLIGYCASVAGFFYLKDKFTGKDGE